MCAGKQTLGISYWEHGQLVSQRFKDLMNPNPSMTWKLPDWFMENDTWIREQLAPRYEELIEYQIWHDCGKPYCRTVDDDGKVHYPNHAIISAGIWLSLNGDPKIGELIQDDMICHQLRPSDAEAFYVSCMPMPPCSEVSNLTRSKSSTSDLPSAGTPFSNPSRSKTMTYEFNTKAEYLSATTMWKADFKTNIIDVRAAKTGIKNSNRDFSLGNKKITAIWDAYRALRKAHEKTAEMHDIRAKMKAEAQRQYLANLE
jgi:hypothetical protein